MDPLRIQSRISIINFQNFSIHRSTPDSPHWRLVVFGILVSFLAMMPFGYQSSVLNIPQRLLMGEVNGSYNVQFNNTMDGYELTGIWSFTVCVYQVGALMGSLAVAYPSQALGRRITFFLICGSVMVVGSTLMGLAFVLDIFELLIVGRLVAGIASGMGGGILAVYVTDVSPVRFRGTIAAIQGVMGVIGVLIGTVLSFPMIMGKSTMVPYLLGLTLGVGLLQLLAFPLFPDSPKYLYINRRDIPRAASALEFYHGPDVNAVEVFMEYDKENALASRKLTLADVIRNPNLRWPLILGCIAGFSSMDTGMLAIMNYSTDIMEHSGFSPRTAGYSTLAIVGISLVGTIVGVFLMRVMGRRKMFLGGLTGILVCNTIFPIVQYVSKKTSLTWLPFAGMAVLVVELTTYSTFVGSIFWFIASEITPHSARSIASSVSIATGSCTSVILLQLFLVLNRAIQFWSFLVLFVAPSIISISILYKYLPETKDKSIGEITSKWWVLDDADPILTEEAYGNDDDDDDDDEIVIK